MGCAMTYEERRLLGDGIKAVHYGWKIEARYFFFFSQYDEHLESEWRKQFLKMAYIWRPL